MAWVGFDMMLALVFLTTAWLGLLRRQVAILGLLVAATMLFTDAWFNVTLSYGTHEQWGAYSLPHLELPFSVLLASSAIGICVERRPLCGVSGATRPTPFSLASADGLDPV